MKILIAGIFFVLCQFSIAQSIEEEFLSNPKFDSQIEKITGLMLQKKELSKSEIENVSKTIDEFVLQFKFEKFKRKPFSKKIKILFDKTHKEFFKKYELVVSFDQIFIDGKYNCVSGTALYSIILDRLGIEHCIVSEPNHVFLIADPEGENIKVECTDPLTGAGSLNEKLKIEFVNALLQQKLVSREEYEGMSDVEIYDSIAKEATEIIPISAIAAFQYSNVGSELMMKDKAIEAIIPLEKALKIYDHPQFKEALLMCYAYQYDINKSDISESNKLIGRITMLLDSFNVAQEIFYLDESCRIIEAYMLQLDYLDSANRVFNSAINNKNVLKSKDVLYECYHRSKMEYYRLTNNFKGMYPSLSVLYHYNPRDLRYKEGINNLSYFLSIVTEKEIDSIGYYLGTSDTLFYPKQVIQDCRQTEEIVKNIAYYNSNNPIGESYFSNLGMIECQEFNKLNEDLVIKVFNKMYYKFLREQENQKAIDIAKKGMELFPESRSLKEKYKMANDTYGKK